MLAVVIGIAAVVPLSVLLAGRAPTLAPVIAFGGASAVFLVSGRGFWSEAAFSLLLAGGVSIVSIMKIRAVRNAGWPWVRNSRSTPGGGGTGNGPLRLIAAVAGVSVGLVGAYVGIRDDAFVLLPASLALLAYGAWVLGKSLVFRLWP